MLIQRGGFSARRKQGSLDWALGECNFLGGHGVALRFLGLQGWGGDSEILGQLQPTKTIL